MGGSSPWREFDEETRPRRGRSCSLSGSSRVSLLSEVMARLRAKYGIRNPYDRYARRAHPASALVNEEQLSLFQRCA